MWWGPATFYPTPRGRRNERLRPEPPDLRPIGPRIRELSLFDHDVWANLEAHAEAAWVRRALAGDWPEEPRRPGTDGQVLELVCRPNLDLHTGTAGWYRRRHGNLRSDDAHAVLSRALAQGGCSADALWFNLNPLPSVAELAARHGNRAEQAVHFTAASIRSLWLDRAERAPRS